MEQIEKLMLRVITPSGSSPVYNCMVGIKDIKRGIHFTGAIGTTNETGKSISTDYSFRTGSITKLFTSTIILQLAEEGLCKLDDFFFDLINDESRQILFRLHVLEDVDYSEKISLLHLLEHRSGLRDYFSDDDRFLNYVMQHPLQLWNWKLVMEKYFEFGLNKKPVFAPGTGYHYSDTNYLLLAVLIEQLTGKPLHKVYRERILIPLKLTDTYLEFYELPAKENPIVYPHYGTHSLEKINSSFDWGAGGLISTMNDLEIFIFSLFKGHLFRNKESVSYQPGVAIQKRENGEQSFFGHTSAYGSMLFYEPQSDISIILTLNQATAVNKAEWLWKKIVLEMGKNQML